jgi:hypothetical protein
VFHNPAFANLAHTGQRQDGEAPGANVSVHTVNSMDRHEAGSVVQVAHEEDTFGAAR